MSTASEWAYRAVQVQVSQPRFECHAADAWDEEKDRELSLIAVVKPEMRIQVHTANISPADACALARWILDVFSEPEGRRTPEDASGPGEQGG